MIKQFESIKKTKKIESNKHNFYNTGLYLFLVPDELRFNVRMEGTAEEAALAFVVVDGAPRWVTLRRLARGRGSVSFELVFNFFD